MFGGKPKKIKDIGRCKIWGVYSRTRSGLIPEFVNQCLNYFLANGGRHLLATGLFRQPGNHDMIQRIKYSVEKRKRLDFAAYSPHDIASAFKQFFSDAADPLFTLDLYDCVMAAAELPLEEQKLECLQKVVELLPPGNLFLLRTLLNFLSYALTHADTNKMNSSNLATCWAPCLIRSSAQTQAASDSSLQMHEVLLAQSIVQLMIDNYALLFPDVAPARHSASASSSSAASLSSSPPSASSPAASQQASSSGRQSTLTPKQAEIFKSHLSAAQQRLSVAVLVDELDPDDQVEPGFFAPEDVSTGDADVDKALAQLHSVAELWSGRLLAQCVDYLLCASSGALASARLFIKPDSGDELRRFESWFAKQSIEKLTAGSGAGRKSAKVFASASGLSAAELASALLVQLLERMPNPLLVGQLHDCWLLAMRQPISDQRLHFRTLYTYLLPPSHRHFLASLLAFLSLVVDQYHATGLSAFLLATTFAPLLLRRPGVAAASSAAYTDDTHQVVQFLIEESSRVCRPPNRKPPLAVYTQLLRSALSPEELASLAASLQSDGGDAPSSPLLGSSSSSSSLSSLSSGGSSIKKFDSEKAKQKAIQKSLPDMLKKRAQLAERGILVPFSKDGEVLSPTLCPPLSDVTLAHIVQYLPDAALSSSGLFLQAAEPDLVRGLVLSLPDTPDLASFSPVTVSQILLCYLRDQLEPVIPFRCYDAFIASLAADMHASSFDHLRAALHALPSGRYQVLSVVADLFARCLARTAADTAADHAINLSRQLAQAIFRCPQLLSGPDAERAASSETAVVKTLLLNYTALFNQPPPTAAPAPAPAPPPRRRTVNTADAAAAPYVLPPSPAARSSSPRASAAASAPLPIGRPAVATASSPPLSPRSPRRFELDRTTSVYAAPSSHASVNYRPGPTSPRLDRTVSSAMPRSTPASPSAELQPLRREDRSMSIAAASPSPGRVSATSVARSLLQQRAELRK